MTDAAAMPMLSGMTSTLVHTETAIEVSGVRRAYGPVQALDGVDLTVRRGELLALLGPNGAGKTTLVEILEGHRVADSGRVDVLGHDPARRQRAFLERIGIVLQEEGLDPNLNVGEAVALYSAAYPNPRPVDEVLELVGLAGRAGDRAATMSGGQRRRLDLALGIAGDPEILFLDEPTTGFDPSARRHAWDVINGLRELGKTILLTTHYMEEAQVLADRVVVLSGGRVIAEGTPDSLGGGGESIVSYRADGRVVRFATTTPTHGPRPDPLRRRRARRGARGPHRHPTQPRGRLPRAHRGPLMTINDLPLLGRWIAARVRMMMRSPRALGFTFAFPLVLVTLFGSLNADQTVTAPVGRDRQVHPVLHAVDRRLRAHAGVLHEPDHRGRHRARDRAAQARARHAAAAAGLPRRVADRRRRGGILSVVLLFVVAVPAFGVHVYADMLPQALLVLVLGAACLGSIGLALGTMAKTADQATPLAQLTMLPISFISGVWFPITDAPSWLVHLAGFFPLKHLVDAFSSCFVPGASVDGADLGSLAIWGAAGMLVAVRRLRVMDGARSRLIPSFR